MRHIYFILAVFAGSLWLISCSDTSVQPEADPDEIVGGVNITQLFAGPQQAELTAIQNEWSSRDVSMQGFELLMTDSVNLGASRGAIKVVAHTVNGVRHIGAIVAPAGRAAASTPVLVLGHGGDLGIDVSGTVAFFPLLFGSLTDSLVYVIPSFRSEPLVLNGTTYLSDGPPSPWDFDVDDGLALLNVTLATTAEADPDRIGVIGFSRGAGVGLLMAIRDPRIDLVVEFFGPTDFFGEFVQEVAIEALEGNPRNLPGLDYINATFIQPLQSGALTIADVRPELIRRSPIFFADQLPQLQVHHGTADSVVYVSQAESLIEVMTNELGRTEPDFESYLYIGAGHDPTFMLGSLGRSIEFIRRLLR